MAEENDFIDLDDFDADEFDDDIDENENNPYQDFKNIPSNGFDIIGNIFLCNPTMEYNWVAFLDIDDDPARLALAQGQGMVILPSRAHVQGHAVKLCNTVEELAKVEQATNSAHFFGRAYVRFLRKTIALTKFLDMFELVPLIYKRINTGGHPDYHLYPEIPRETVKGWIEILEQESREFYGKHMLNSDKEFIRALGV